MILPKLNDTAELLPMSTIGEKVQMSGVEMSQKFMAYTLPIRVTL